MFSNQVFHSHCNIFTRLFQWFSRSTNINKTFDWFVRRSRGRPVSAFLRLFRGLLLCPSLLDQDLQAGAAPRRSVHQTTQERLAQLGDLSALRLRQRPGVQSVEGRHVLLQVQTAHVPADLRGARERRRTRELQPECVPCSLQGARWRGRPLPRTQKYVKGKHG